MTKKLLWPVFFFVSCAAAQPGRMPLAFPYVQLAAYSNQFRDAFSFTANQGSLAFFKRPSAGLYSERRFLLKELSSCALAMVIPSASGNFGFNAAYMGNAGYNESTLGIAYARSLGSNVAIGVQFNYVGVKVAGYGKTGTLNFDAGAFFRVTPSIQAGLHVYNPVAAGWGEGGTEKLPAVYSVGIGYDASPQVFVGAAVEKVGTLPVSVNAGIHYQVARQLVAKLGVRTGSSIYYFGFGVQLAFFRLDATVSLHPYLGPTPGLLLLYRPQE